MLHLAGPADARAVLLKEGRCYNEGCASHARKEGDAELRQNGFKVLAPDDYPSSLKSTTVLYSSGNEQAAATVASSADLSVTNGADTTCK